MHDVRRPDSQVVQLVSDPPPSCMHDVRRPDSQVVQLVSDPPPCEVERGHASAAAARFDVVVAGSVEVAERLTLTGPSRS